MNDGSECNMLRRIFVSYILLKTLINKLHCQLDQVTPTAKYQSRLSLWLAKRNIKEVQLFSSSSFQYVPTPALTTQDIFSKAAY